VVFVFQAEDGIRDYKVTGVQTCALPILEAVNRLLVEVSEQQLADEPRMEELRRSMLARAVSYYKRFRALHGDDPRLRAEMAEAKIGRASCRERGKLAAASGTWKRKEYVT